MASTPPPTPAQVIAGRYRLDEPVGSGGMATVWSGTDLVLNRRVAIKVLHAHLRNDPAFLARFRHEAKVAARVTHHGIVSVYDTAEDDDAEAIVLEFVDGITLREHLDRVGRLSARDVTELGIDLCDALDAAHRSGLVHRDIKPANILIAFDGTVKIADFGIAKVDGDGEMTQAGTVIGTASYLAPEQLQGAPVDQRTDLFSVGVVLYEALCGTTPFSGDTDAARALARLHQSPEPPGRIVEGVPRPLEAAVMSALERSPDDRPDDASDLGRRLLMARRQAVHIAEDDEPLPAPRRDVTAEQPAVPRPKRATRAAPARRRRRRRRPRTSTIILSLLIGGAVALAAILFIQPRQTTSTVPTTQPPAAPALLRRADAIPFDPLGTGQPGENNGTRRNAIDGNPTTFWRTEEYQQRTFGTKPGVGIIVELASVSRITGVTVRSPTKNWAGDIYVLPTTAIPTAVPDRPDAVIGATTGDATVTVSPVTGRAVLLWITDLGDGPAPFRFDTSEIEVRGTP